MRFSNIAVATFVVIGAGVSSLSLTALPVASDSHEVTDIQLPTIVQKEVLPHDLPTIEKPEPQPEPVVVESPAPVPAPASEPEYVAPSPTPAPAPVPAPAPRATVQNFYPTGYCGMDCWFDGSPQAVVDAHAESTLCLDHPTVTGCYVGGHNFNGMGDKVLSLQIGDTVIVHSGEMAGTFKVSGIRHYGVSDSPAAVGFPTGFALSTCLWDNSAMRMVDLVRA